MEGTVRVRHITLNWLKLAKYSLLFVMFCLTLTLGAMVWITGSLPQALLKSASLSGDELKLAFELSLTLFIYIGFPILAIRFIYFFTKLLAKGRKPGVNIITHKTLFNPLNFLLFPHLLNTDGLTYRRRCILSILLMLGLYTSIFIVT